jgi:hypothetical protein
MAGVLAVGETTAIEALVKWLRAPAAEVKHVEGAGCGGEAMPTGFKTQ